MRTISRDSAHFYRRHDVFMKCKVVPANPDDSVVIVELFRKLASESDFMMYETNEIPTSEMLRQKITHNLGTGRETFFLAQTKSQSIGCAVLTRGTLSRNSGVGTLILGVLKAYHRKGVGSQLIEAVIAWSKKEGVYRLQLQVHRDNKRAVGLYMKFGFKTEGILHKCALIKGNFIDKYQMALLL